MIEYVIHKTTRAPRDESYAGPTWDRAQLRHLYRRTYLSYDNAKAIANVLSKYNPIGFIVSEKSRN